MHFPLDNSVCRVKTTCPPVRLDNLDAVPSQLTRCIFHSITLLLYVELRHFVCSYKLWKYFSTVSTVLGMTEIDKISDRWKNYFQHLFIKLYEISKLACMSPNIEIKRTNQLFFEWVRLFKPTLSILIFDTIGSHLSIRSEFVRLTGMGSRRCNCSN